MSENKNNLNIKDIVGLALDTISVVIATIGAVSFLAADQKYSEIIVSAT
jgi:hypothetical protein